MYWIRIGFQPKLLDPDPDEMNADPQPWYLDYIMHICSIDFLLFSFSR